MRVHLLGTTKSFIVRLTNSHTGINSRGPLHWWANEPSQNQNQFLLLQSVSNGSPGVPVIQGAPDPRPCCWEENSKGKHCKMRLFYIEEREGAFMEGL